MSVRDPDEVEQFVERLGGALAAAGMPLQPARVFAALLAADSGRLTSADLAAALGISASAVSGAVGYLIPLGLIRRERERGSRRDVYVVSEDSWHDAMVREDQAYAPIMAALADGVQAARHRPQARARLALSLEFLEFVRSEMEGVASRWQAHRRVAERAVAHRAGTG
jgi:predicted transcriptional regulator